MYYLAQTNYPLFVSQMYTVLLKGVTQGIVDGLDAVDEENILFDRYFARSLVMDELAHVNGLADTLDRLRNNEGDPDTVSRRIDLWAGTYEHAKYYTMVSYGGKKRLKWISEGESSCDECSRLNGKVRTANWWLEHNTYPKAWGMQCRRGCTCRLEMTTEPVS